MAERWPIVWDRLQGQKYVSCDGSSMNSSIVNGASGISFNDVIDAIGSCASGRSLTG